MVCGLNGNGFIKKTIGEIRQEMVDASKAKFGESINVQPETPLGQLIDIMSERELLMWEELEAVYLAQNPNSSEGINLDRACSLVGVVRLAAANSTVVARCFGTPTTLITTGSQIQVSGDAINIFQTIEDGTIAAAVNEIQTITFDDVPTAGTFTLTHEGNTTANINWNDTFAAVQAALEALASIGAGNVTVTGDFATGFICEFVSGMAGIEVEEMTATSALLILGNPVTIEIEETTGGGAYIDINCENMSTGPFICNVGALTEILTPISGWTSTTNKEEAVIGRDEETDAELRERRDDSLNTSDAGTLEAIRSELLTLTGVTHAIGFENDTGVTVGIRTPHSIEVFVQGGDEDEIAETIWITKACGIGTSGITTKTVTDSEGVNRTIKFSRPSEVDIFIDVTLTMESGYTVTSDEVKAAIEEYFDTLNIGDDVKTLTKIVPALSCAFPDIIRDIEIYADTIPAPAINTPLTIDEDELAVVDPANISVTVI